MRSRSSFQRAAEPVQEEKPEICPSCGKRPAWQSNRLPVCEPCFALAPSIEKLEFWRSLDRAVSAADMPKAVKAARARLVRATRVG